MYLAPAFRSSSTLLRKGFLGHHADPGMPFEFLECPALKGLDHIGIGRIGEDDVAPLMEHLGLLEISDLDLAADILCSLSPLEFNALDPEFFNGILLNAETSILDIGLDDDGSVAVSLVILIEFDPALQVHGIDDPAILDHGSGSMPTTFSPMVRPVPERADPIASPSQLFLAISVEPIPEMIQGYGEL